VEYGESKGKFHCHEGIMIQNVHSQQSHARQDGRPEEILATIPQKGGDTALEVVMTHDSANEAHIELRYLVWGIGLGWYRQHTLKLDGTTARDLIRALGIVQRRTEHQTVESLAQNVLPFSHTRKRQHPAVTV
jgi:hypothetical protein